MPRIVGDNVLIKMDDPQIKTESGIEIYEFISTATTPMTGTVLAAGDGIYVNGRRIPVSVRPKDKVMIPKWAGQEIDINGAKYVLVRETEILAVVE